MGVITLEVWSGRNEGGQMRSEMRLRRSVMLVKVQKVENNTMPGCLRTCVFSGPHLSSTADLLQNTCKDQSDAEVYEGKVCNFSFRAGHSSLSFDLC